VQNHIKAIGAAANRIAKQEALQRGLK
jgi:hypothetical protein